MNATSKPKIHVARNSDELGKMLGLSKADTALMKYKSELSSWQSRQSKSLD